MFEDQRILGHVFAAPYGLFEPSLAFVAEDEAGVGGYIVGALDTRAFEKRLEADWWPALRDRYPAPQAGLPPDQRTPDQRAAGFIHVPLTVPDEITEDYPSHLHINLVPRLQSQGLGRQLMDTLIRALQGQGSVGLHFFVARQPAGSRLLPASWLHRDLRRGPRRLRDGSAPGRLRSSIRAVPFFRGDSSAWRPSSRHCPGDGSFEGRVRPGGSAWLCAGIRCPPAALRICSSAC